MEKSGQKCRSEGKLEGQRKENCQNKQTNIQSKLNDKDMQCSEANGKNQKVLHPRMYVCVPPE